MNMNRNRPGLGLGFALGVSIDAATGADNSDVASFNFGGDIFTGFFGGSSSGTAKQDGTETVDTTRTEQVNIDEEGLLRLIDKSLEGIGGLAAIFGNEVGAGLFGSSSAKSQTEDLLAKIAGELALVTGEKVATEKGTKETTSVQTQEQESGGALGSITDLFRF